MRSLPYQRRLITALTAAALIAFLTTTIRAENEGQADLDMATELQLTAETLGDLEKVIKLAESALKKGLDKGQTEFAKQMLAATLFQHANRLGRVDLRADAAQPALADRSAQQALKDLDKAKTYDADAARHLPAGSQAAGAARRRREGGPGGHRRGHQAAQGEGRAEAAGQGLHPAGRDDGGQGQEAGRF